MDDTAVREGEDIRTYIKRMHAQRQPDGRPPSNGCNCPTAFSRCRWAVAHDRHTGDRTHGHGGWGWGS